MQEVMRIAGKKIPVLQMKEGFLGKKGSLLFIISDHRMRKYAGNDSSLVLYMTTTGPSFLFTGDMEAEGERHFLRNMEGLNSGQFILKAGHHGSRTSSTEPFVSALQPVLTIFSAGRNNRYGHPHPEVMEIFRKRGLKTMSTAEWGSITVTVKGRWLSNQVDDRMKKRSLLFLEGNGRPFFHQVY